MNAHDEVMIPMGEELSQLWIAGAAHLRAKHPEWPEDYIIERTRRSIIALADDIISAIDRWAIEEAAQVTGGEGRAQYKAHILDAKRRGARGAATTPHMVPSTQGDQFEKVNLCLADGRVVAVSHPASIFGRESRQEREQRLRFLWFKRLAALAGQRGALGDEVTLLQVKSLIDHVPFRFYADNDDHQAAKRVMVGAAKDRRIGRERAMQEAKLAAAMLVLDQWERVCPKRLGRGEGSAWVGHAPSQLRWTEAWGWFCAEVGRALVAMALDRPYPDESEKYVRNKPEIVSASEFADTANSDADDPLLALLTERGRYEEDPLDTLLANEGHDEARQALQGILAEATMMERAVFGVLQANGFDTADAARELGIAPSTVRVHWKNLKDKAKARTA